MDKHPGVVSVRPCRRGDTGLRLLAGGLRTGGYALQFVSAP